MSRPPVGEGSSGVVHRSSRKSVAGDFDSLYNQICEEQEVEGTNFANGDYEADDDLFNDNIEKEVNENNEIVQGQDLEDDDALEDAYPNLSKEEDEK